MDATLGAREPLARTTGAGRSRSTSARDTSTSPAEPLIEETAEGTPSTDSTDTSGAAETKRLPTAEELYARPATADTVAEAPAGAAVASADAPTERIAADTTDTNQEAAVDTTKAAATDVQATGAAGSPAAPSEAPAPPAADASAPVDETAPTAPDAAPGDPAAGPTAAQQAGRGRTVGSLADRLDDSRFFSSLFDFTFTNYVTRKLAGPVYVVGLVLIALGIIVGFANSLTSAIATHAPIGAFVFLFGVLITLVGAMLSVLLLRVGIEVFCAIIEIAQNTRRRRPPGE
ncbi:protein of unknown function [Leifsonia sp. 21MFCrub1.1]|nr:protein of unknown function [Leifsonia sp. 21MFCrub1.1]